MPRQAHAALDAASRYPKAAKIHRLLDLPDGGECERRLLEIGTGAGVIASYFARLSSPRYVVEAVDTVDQRQLSEGYAFQQVEGTQLPYADASFDIVISNHVIEHVGDAPEQLRHLQEIARVLQPAGQAYLAVPSRWQIVEPHYRLAWLSWLPASWRTPYLRLRQAGHDYDCRPLSKRQLERMLRDAGLAYRNVLPQALDIFVRQEKAGSWLASLASRLPRRLLNKAAALSPTHAYLLSHRSDGRP